MVILLYCILEFTKLFAVGSLLLSTLHLFTLSKLLALDGFFASLLRGFFGLLLLANFLPSTLCIFIRL